MGIQKGKIGVSSNSLKKMRSGIVHYTMSDHLDKILSQENVILKASCFSRYWKQEENSHDDSAEFIGALKSVDFKNMEFRYKFQNEKGLNYETKVGRKAMRGSDCFIDNGSIPTVAAPLHSTETQYFCCFSSLINDCQMYSRFCNLEYGVPVMLIFNPEILLQTGCENCNDEKSSLILLPVSYYKEDSETMIPSMLKDKMKEIKECRDQVENSEEGNTSGDNHIEACLFLKRRTYESEEELRLVYIRQEAYKFWISNGNYNFQFTESTQDKKEDGKDKSIYLKLPPKCLSAIMFGPCVDLERARMITAFLSETAFKDTPVFLHNWVKVR